MCSISSAVREQHPLQQGLWHPDLPHAEARMCQRTASITTRIKTAVILAVRITTWGQRTASITTRIETDRRCDIVRLGRGSENSIHYNKDWDKRFPVLGFRFTVREQHPLQQGLRLESSFDCKSSSMSENSIHYNKDWDLFCHNFNIFCCKSENSIHYNKDRDNLRVS